MSKKRSTKNGSKKDDWETPDFVIKAVKKEFGINYDIACNSNNCKCEHAYFDKGINGLENIIPKDSVIWCNPPYSRKLKELFIKRCCELSFRGYTSIMLIPATMETGIFHKTIFPNAEVRCIEKRIPFKGYNTKGEYVTDKTGQSGHCLIIFKKGTVPKIIPYKFTEVSADSSQV